MSEIRSEVTGRVLSVERREGDSLSRGDTILLLESMKMEIAVEADQDGIVRKVLVGEGEAVAEGQTLAILEGTGVSKGTAS